MATLVLKIISDGAGATKAVEGLSRGLDRAKDSAGNLRKETGLLSKAVGHVSNEVRDLAKGLVAGFGAAAAVRTLSSASEMAREFGREVAKVSTALTDTSQMDRYISTLRSMSREYGLSASAQAASLYEIISAGQQAEQAILTLDAANRLAIGGLTSVETAADGLTSVMNAYAGKIRSAKQASDVMFAGAAAGKTNIEQLSSTLGQVAPIAAAVGVSFDELVGSVAALTLGGVSTNVAVTQMRSVLSSLVKPSSEAQKLAEDLGLEFTMAALRAKGLAGFLEDVREKTGGSERAIATLFGQVEATGAVLALTGNQAASFAKTLDATANSAGATEAAYTKMADTADQAFKKARAAAQSLLIDLGTQLNSILVPAAKAFADNADLIAATLSVVVKVGAAYLALFVALPAVYTAATVASWNFVASLTAQNVGFLASIKSMGALRAAGGLLLAAFAGWEIGTQLRDQFLEVRLFGIAMVQGLMESWERMKQGAAIVWEAIKYAAIGAFNIIKERVADMVLNLAGAVEAIDFTGLYESAIAGARSFAAGLKPAVSASDQFAQAVTKINTETDAEIAKIGQISSEMADYEIEAERAKEANARLADSAGDVNAEITNTPPALETSAEALRDYQTAAKNLSGILNAQARAMGDEYVGAALDFADVMTVIAEQEAELVRLGKLDAEMQSLLAQARQNATAQYQQHLADLRDTPSIQEDILANLDDEIEMLGLNNEQLQIAEIVRRAEQDAMRAKKPLSAAEIANLEAEVAARLKVINTLRQQRQASDDWNRTWAQAGGAASDAIADFAVSAITDFDNIGDHFKSLGKSLADIAKRTVSQLISEFLRMRVINPILNNVFGTALQTGGSGGGILGSLLGGSGGGSSAGGLTGIGAALPGLLAVGGILAGLKNPGNSGLATAGRVGAYGVGGYVLGTVGYGAMAGAAGAMAGAGAGVGAASAAASGAMSGAAGAAGAIPVVGWIIAAIAAIDMITGGKVFGTKYRPESASQTLAINSQGGSASGTMTEVRQRSLFRGRQWRTSAIPATEEAREAAQGLFDSVKGAMVDAARALEVEVPPVIDAAIRTVTEYDKKGKVKTSQIFVDVLGRTFKETDPEKAGMRIVAEGILAVLATAVTEQVSLAKPAIDTAVSKLFDAGDRDDEFGGGRGGIGGGAATPATQTMNEVHAIAERWRKDAELLLEGAQFLVLAQQQIKEGNNLLGEGASLTRIADLVEEMQRGEETLSETFTRLLANVDLMEMALDRVGVDIGKTGEEFVKFSTDFVDAAGGLERAASLWESYIGTFFTAEEAAQELLNSARTRADRALEGIGLDSNTTREQFRLAFEAALPTLEPEEIVRWLEASRALAEVDDAIDRVAQVALEAAQFTQGLADAVFEQEASEFQQSMMQIRRSVASSIEDADALARARGAEGASARDLALIHRWAANEVRKAIAQLENAARNLVNELGYGELDTVLSQIAQIEAASSNAYNSQLNGVEAVGAAGRDLFAEWEQGVKSLQDYIDGLLVGELSPLSPEEQMAEARRQLDEALASASAGDVDALNALPQLADQWLRMLKGSEASGMDYSGPAQALIDQLRALGVNPYSPISTNPNQGPVQLVPSPELEALYQRRDELLAQQTANERLLMAQELAGYVVELAEATGRTVFAVMEDLGINLASFITDLGATVTADTAEAVVALGEVANTLGVELPELADAIGASLGELNDTQSLINDAFELQLSTLPEEFRTQLEPAFRALEDASSPEETNVALDELNRLTEDLPEEFRLRLAPYLSQVDPITPDLANELDYLSDISETTAAANALLEQIRQQLVIANGGTIPDPPPEAASAVALVDGGSKVGDAQTSAIIVELQMLREAVRKAGDDQKAAVEQGARSSADAALTGADRVRESVDNLRAASGSLSYYQAR